jgi:hypothetical protein
VTARWVVDEVAPERDLRITWKPISLLFKNEVTEDNERYGVYYSTHRMLRVMESVRKSDGDDAVFPLYWEFGKRIHHDSDREAAIEDILETVGIDVSHAAAADDDSWDPIIRAAMDEGLELAGNDIGTPIIAFDNAEGDRTAYFGPVITRVPEKRHSLDLWDGLVQIASVPGFWELKRTRTERPEFGERP